MRLSSLLIFNDSTRVIRERILINHDSPEKREIIDEFTIYNKTTEDVDNIFLIKKGFMAGLRITDESNRELPLLSNESLKALIRPELNGKDPEKNEQLKNLLEDIEKHRRFVLWIKLSKENAIHPKNFKIVKLTYKNQNLGDIKIGRKDWLKTKLDLFTIPSFLIDNIKHKDSKHDIFYVISMPEGFILRYTIKENVKIKNMIPTTISENDGMRVNKELKEKEIKLISIRIPPFEQESRFSMIYQVLPEKTDRKFYCIVLFSLIGISIFISIISTKLGHGYEHLVNIENVYPILHQIYTKVDPVFGGLITISLAAIGFMRSYSLSKTRFWFIIPIIISALGFLLKKS